MLDVWASSPLKLSKHCPDDNSIPSLYQFPAVASRSHVRLGSLSSRIAPMPSVWAPGIFTKTRSSPYLLQRVKTRSDVQRTDRDPCPSLVCSQHTVCRMQFQTRQRTFCNAC